MPFVCLRQNAGKGEEELWKFFRAERKERDEDTSAAGDWGVVTCHQCDRPSSVLDHDEKTGSSISHLLEDLHVTTVNVHFDNSLRFITIRVFALRHSYYLPLPPLK